MILPYNTLFIGIVIDANYVLVFPEIATAAYFDLGLYLPTLISHSRPNLPLLFSFNLPFHKFAV
jgi:hypothetical protein